MKLRFWGVRGSIASPGPHTVRYGGNTTCLEVIGDNGEEIILDAGTGIAPLSRELIKRAPVKCAILLTHTHWDHIQGLPFFVPLFVPGTEITVYGAFDPVTGRDIGQILSRQMEYCFFPVRECELKADITYRTLKENETVEIGSVTVTNQLMSHPVLAYGYRLECNGRALAFTGDHEPPANIYRPEDPGYLEFEELLGERRQHYVEFTRGVDVLVADSAYTEQEYQTRQGWGHGTLDSALEFAARTGAGRLYCTHHEPTRSDEALTREFQAAQARHPLAPDAFLAREGDEISI